MAGRGRRERLSFEFCRRKNQPPSFPRCRFEAGHGRTRVQSGPAAKRHHRKIRRLFLRGTPAKSKRKPLHHVLRTAGTTGRFIKGPCGKAGAEQGPGERGQSEEVRGQGKAPKGWQGGGVGAMGREGGGGGGGEQPHGRTRTGTDKHGRLERAECRGRRSGKTEQPEQPLRSASAATEQPNSR